MMHGRENQTLPYSWEADEQSGPDRSGAGGAKGGGQGNAHQQSTHRTQCGNARHRRWNAYGKLCRYIPKAGAVCGNSARTDLKERLGSGPLRFKNPRREAMLEPEEVSAILRLNELGWGANGLSGSGISRNTARDYIAAGRSAISAASTSGPSATSGRRAGSMGWKARSPDLVGSPRIDESPFSARC